ncbi:hypothetical protein EF847_02985 [Actinobacteria bacterium YIM 96077]|uniref:Uncharacterized protein n=1 Tax=Phytoactinopolyspora halophila TaxID=1981511 RepID=A0A329QHL6_9ACTN|nr:hypothetical protein EF847_02985 [Actinobacteria bacterium YIM 96077]RAW09858.1 hypothetical protein DPM12_20160 [Phytoactinopolyspora halophila]
MRGIGIGIICLGLALIGAVLALAASVGGVPAIAVWTVLGLLAMAGIVLLGTGIVRVAGWRTRFVMDDDGFANATGPGAGVRRAAWRDVRRVQADGAVVSVDLAGSRQSVIRTDMLDVSARELARELRKRLNQDRGYTPFGTAAAESTGTGGAQPGSDGEQERSSPDT